MSCDNWTYCAAVVDFVPCSLASDVDGYASPAEANLERVKSLQQGRPDSPPIVPNQKGTGMKSDRASFQILHKQTLNTSGATKDRSMSDGPDDNGHSQNLRKSQTGMIFGLRQSQQ
jgi:hypothetical protein